MNLNNIDFSTNSRTSKIKYSSKPTIDFDKFSSNGVKRHIDFKIINGKIASEKKFEFDIVRIDSSDETELEAIDGTEIVFQSYPDEPNYLCTCSLTFGYRLENSQMVKSCSVILKVIRELIFITYPNGGEIITGTVNITWRS